MTIPVPERRARCPSSRRGFVRWYRVAVRHFPLAVFIVLAAGACTEPPTVGDPVDLGREGEGEAPPCAVDDDCPFGEECLDAACQPVDALVGDVGCRSDDDCADGLSCAVATGVCVPDAALPPAVPGPPGPCVDGATRTCGEKIGVCEYGVERCVDEQWSGACEGGRGPDPAERCNDLDDDCDGDADDGFALGVDCAEGLGVCRQEGFTRCAADGLATECSAPGLDAADRIELCGNGLDDDCDGVDDDELEFATLGDACVVGVGACATSGTLVCAGDGRGVVCDATPGTPAAQELCGNGVDDDCNGAADEDDGFAALGDACAIGTTCPVPGTFACTVDRRDLECLTVAPIGPEALCDGDDEDVDGCPDDGFALEAACAVGVGACRRTGETICNSTQDGIACDATAGTAGTELCGNTVDEDCNGQLDNGFNLGAACSVGVGACQRSGTLVCDVGAGGTRATCSATAGAPGVERCGNAIDEDCSGAVDNGFAIGAACTNGAGICQRPGLQICNTANTLTTTCNAVPGAPNPLGELCDNGENDDCDAQTDEGFANLTTACSQGAGECTRGGSFVCSADRTATVCNAQAAAPVPETCDDKDNDCNTVIDNGCDDDDDDFCDAALAWLPVGATVDACPLSSSAADLDCNDTDGSIHPDAAEICLDARDQNCDGDNNDGCRDCDPAIDNDFDGSNECLDCDDTNGNVRPGGLERCDGLDNNCDGRFDEPFDVDGDGFTICGTIAIATGGLDPSRVDCNDTPGAGITVFPGACELCANAQGTVACGSANDRGNTVDENCNGFVDETCFPCNANDVDGDGASQCDGDCADNDPAVRPGRAEVCDGKDTDCNRTTVDNCGIGEECGTRAGGPFPGTTDACREDLICVTPINNSGAASGDPTCTSLCNNSFLNGGVGDGCQAAETCAVNLVPTANLNGCQPTTATLGTRAGGDACTDDAQCRSGDCFNPQGPATEICLDHCGSDSYCGATSNCMVLSSTATKAFCFPPTSGQNRATGTACSGATSACAHGSGSCIDMNAVLRCSEPCCTNTDCPSNFYCSLNGPSTAQTGGGVNTIPQCFAETSGNGGRQAGAACSSNTQCASEFCDKNLNVCIDVCCSDDTCPIGLGCEDALVVGGRPAGQTFGRFCLSSTPAAALEKR